MTVQTTQVQEARVSSAPVVDNLLINPGFEIWQRGAGPFTSEEVFTADEWYLDTSSGADPRSVQRSSSSKFGEYCLEVTSWTTIPERQLSIKQGIEAGPSLHGKWLTFSVWVKAAFEGQVQARIHDDDGSSTNNFKSDYHTGSGEWENLVASGEITYAAKGTGSVNDPHGFGLWVSIDCTGQFPSPYLIDGAVCSVGYFPEGIPFVPPNPEEDLSRAQRFYYADTSYQSSNIFRGDVVSGYEYLVDKVFKTPMYATPTITKTAGNESGFSATSNFQVSPWGLIEYRESNSTASGRFFWSNISAEIS